MTDLAADQKAWLDQVQEETVDPALPIVDPHHHLWHHAGGVLPPYLLEDLWADTGSGHNIVKTVFIECNAEYKKDGPEHLRPVGETEFVAGVAKESRGHGKAEISAIVAHTDLCQDAGVIGEVLDAHEAAGEGLLRGIRHGGAFDTDGSIGWLNATEDPEQYANDGFRAGVAQLGKRGLTYDTWHYHMQNRGYADLARAVPETTMILDHFGTPAFVGSYADKRQEVYEQWKVDMAEIAACDNVVAKLGGLAMPSNGFGWNSRETPATSDEVAAAQREFYLHMIDCFGPDRCMMESNFPVDKMSLSYHTFWNAAKKITADFSEDEKNAMFSGTATRVYKL